MSINSDMWVLRSTFILFLVNLPFLILNRSSKSLTKNYRSSAEFINILWYFLPCSFDMNLSRLLPIPRIALSGVRISCDIVAVIISRKWFCNLSCWYFIKWVMLFVMIIVCFAFWNNMGWCLKVNISDF